MAALPVLDWLELAGLVSGLLCVWLLIRQNVWTFPLGLVYSGVSVAVFTAERLYADVLLSAYYVVMNGYGWYYWLYGGRRPAEGGTLPVTRAPGAVRWTLAGVTALATVLMGSLLAAHTDADLPFWDSATTIMSFAAMWMTARKYIESWILWLLVDVIATGIYLYKGIAPYALLYAVYLVMAIMGWRAWNQSAASSSA